MAQKCAGASVLTRVLRPPTGRRPTWVDRYVGRSDVARFTPPPRAGRTSSLLIRKRPRALQILGRLLAAASKRHGAES